MAAAGHQPRNQNGIDPGNACLKSIAGFAIHVERGTLMPKKAALKQT